MPWFEYVARDQAGENREGRLQASDSSMAARTLKRRELYPVTITRAEPSGWGASLWHRLRPVAPSRLAQFFTQLADLLGSGINLHDALDELSHLTGDRRLARVARESAEAASEGVPLGEQMARYPAIFPRHAVGLVRAGEQFGGLPEMLTALAEQYETRERLEGRVKWLRLYYGAVLVLALLVAPFPWMVARGIGWYGGLLVTRLLPILLGLIVAYFGLKALSTLPSLAHLKSRVLLSLPVVGSMPRWSAVVRFLRTMNLSQRAGVTLDEGLELAGEATGHPPMREAARAAAARVRDGAGMDEVVADLRFLPKRVRQMLTPAEHAGVLEQRLAAATQWAAEKRDSSVNSTSAGTATVALVGSAIIAAVALAIAWRNFYEALFERAGV